MAGPGRFAGGKGLEHMLVPDVEKIAIVRANALGDYLFSLPALDALRAAYPSAELVLLGAPWHALSSRDGRGRSTGC